MKRMNERMKYEMDKIDFTVPSVIQIKTNLWITFFVYWKFMDFSCIIDLPFIHSFTLFFCFFFFFISSFAPQTLRCCGNDFLKLNISNQMINNGLHLMQVLQKISANGGQHHPVQLDKWLVLLHKILRIAESVHHQIENEQMFFYSFSFAFLSLFWFYSNFSEIFYIYIKWQKCFCCCFIYFVQIKFCKNCFIVRNLEIIEAVQNNIWETKVYKMPWISIRVFFTWLKLTKKIVKRNRSY